MATLEKVAHINDLSPKTKEELIKRVKNYGRIVKYKFDLERKNPDPEKVNGAFIVPSQYSLHPLKVSVFDKNHDNGGRQVELALVESTDDKGIPNKFKTIRVLSHDRCVIELDTEDVEQMQTAMYLEVHSKNKNSMFPNPSAHHVYQRIDENQFSTEKRTERSAKMSALSVAMGMSDAEIMEFATAMLWEGHDDPSKIDIMRNSVEAEAEKDPDKFKTAVESKKIKYLATIKKGIDNKKIIYSPNEKSFSWNGEGNTIFICSQGSVKTPNDQFAEWLMTDEGKAKEVFKKLLEVAK